MTGNPPETSATQPEQGKSWKSYAMLVLQTVISVGLLGWVLGDVDRSALAQAMTGASIPLLVLAVFVLSLYIWLNAWRWKLVWPGVAAGRTEPPPTLALVRLIMIGNFFNQVLPPPIGGDAFRVIGTKRLGLTISGGLLSIMIERLWGLLALCLLVLPSLPFLLPDFMLLGLPRPLASVLLTLIGLVGLVLCYLIAGWLTATLLKKVKRPLLITLLEQVRETSLTPKRALRLLGLSILGQLPPLACMTLIALALPGTLPPLTALIVAPLALFATLIPISFAGWGVREGVVIALLASHGVGSPQALALSLCFGLGLLIISLPGALLWRLRKIGRAHV